MTDQKRNPAAEAGNGENRCLPPAGNCATGWLKIIALGFMIIDHMGVVVFPNAGWMRVLGRIAFPLYCWCMVVGFHYTRSVPRYLLRILVVGLISQPLYTVAMNHLGPELEGVSAAWAFARRYLIGSRVNIFLTLLLGLLGMWSIREKKAGSQFWGPVAVICLATALGADYGWKGVLFMMLLYAARGSRPAIAAVMIAFFLYWGTGYSVTLLIPLPFSLNSLPGWLYQPLSAFLRLETYGLLSLPFILCRFRKNLKMPVWLGYAMYPAHLVLIMVLKAIFAL